MPQPTVLLTGNYCEVFREPLAKRLGPGWALPGWSAADGRDDLIRKSAQASVVLPSAEYVYSGVLEDSIRAAKNLRLLQLPFSGWDWLRTEWLAPGCAVCNLDVHAAPIGEYVMLAILESAIGMHALDRTLRRGDWSLGGSMVLGRKHREIGGRVLGIVGYGQVGQAVARRASAFGMKTLAVSRHPRPHDPEPVEWWRDMSHLDELLAASDFVVLALPLTPQTTGLIDRRRLELIGPQGTLVNVARSKVVVEADLYHALRDRRLGSAVIDVWPHYPTPEEPQGLPSRNFPFHELDNTILTPHCAGWTVEQEQRRIESVCRNVGRFAAGEPLENIVTTTPAGAPDPA